MTASRPDNEVIFHAARDIPDPDRRGVRPGGVRRRRGPDRPRPGAARGRRPHRQPARPSRGGPSRGDHRPAYHREPRHGDRPVQVHRADRRGRHGSVWMAQQTEPVKRLVAIKSIKAGMDSRQAIAASRPSGKVA